MQHSIRKEVYELDDNKKEMESNQLDPVTEFRKSIYKVFGSRDLRDQFTNTQMKIGNADLNINEGGWDYERNFLNWFLWTKLYNESWVFRNGIDKKSDATVSELEIDSTAEPTEIDNVIVEYQKHVSDLKYLLSQSAVYGGAASLMLIEGFINEEHMKEELDISRIPKGAKMSLLTRDRWNGLQWEGKAGLEALGTSDFKSFKYYKFYMQGEQDTSNNKDDKDVFLKAHFSYVLKGRNRKATTYTRYQLSGWDMPEGHHMLTELRRDETIRGSAASLVAKSLLEVVKMAGIRGLISGIAGNVGGDNGSSAQELEARIAGISNYRNFNNLVFMDEKDEYEQFQFNGFAGIADILQQQKKFTAGAMEIPELILYGSMETKGLMFMDDGSLGPEIEIYQQMLNNRQDYILRPIMDKLIRVLWRIANGTDMPEGTTYKFLPVFKESQTAKLDRTKVLVETMDIALKNGSISPKVAAQEYRQLSKQTGVFTNLTDDIINKMSDEPISNEEIKANAQKDKENEKEIVKKDNEKLKKDNKNLKDENIVLKRYFIRKEG